jgi:hypothetical protein
MESIAFFNTTALALAGVAAFGGVAGFAATAGFPGADVFAASVFGGVVVGFPAAAGLVCAKAVDTERTTALKTIIFFIDLFFIFEIHFSRP